MTQALLGQDLVDPGPVLGPFARERIAPGVAGAVGAFRDPESPGLPAEILAVRVPALPDLLADALVPGKKGEIAVCRRRGQDLDLAAVPERPEGPDDVLAEAAVEILEELFVPAFPEGGHGAERRVTGPAEKFPVAGGDIPLHPQVSVEFPDEAGVLELVHQDGREADARPGRKAFAGQPLEDVEKRQVGLRGGFEEPVHPVRPAAVGEDVGNVAVQDEGEELIGHAAPSVRWTGAGSPCRPKRPARPGRGNIPDGLYQIPPRIGKRSSGRTTTARRPPRARR